MTKSRQLLVAVFIIAGCAQLVAALGWSTIWTALLLAATNLVACVLGYRTGHYRVFWLLWGAATLATFSFLA
jgi:hypothetical protein